MLLLALLSFAAAGDVPVYRQAVELIETRWLRAAEFSPQRAFQDAGAAVEEDVEWLLVDARDDRLLLRDGDGRWRAEVVLADAPDLPAALARLEDAVRAAGRPLDGVDLRAAILEGVAHQLDRPSVVLRDRGLERFDERMTGTLSGIGSTLRARNGTLVVVELQPGGPAARGGLQAGDRILRIDGASTVGMRVADATRRIRGATGTPVTLLVSRDGPTGVVERTYILRRETLQVRNVRARMGPDGVGVVVIEHFSEQTRAWLDEALEDLREQGGLREGLIIDLRGNTGGSLAQSALAADAFLGSGTIVTTATRDGKPAPGLIPRLDAHPDARPIDVPIAVLVDGATASGSEIMAGALGRRGRAVLIGSRTFGKGTVQKVYPLADQLKLKLTVAEYLVEGVQRVADVGLQPDVALDPVVLGDDLEPGVTRVPSGEGGLDPPAPVMTMRHLAEDGRDVALLTAVAVLREADSSSRQATLEALGRVRGALEAEETRRLVEAFRARGLDWSAAPPATAPRLDIQWTFADAPVAGRPAVLAATVTNRGATTVPRASLRLVSDAGTWDDVRLAVGTLAPGATARVQVRVTPSARSPSRTDTVQTWVDAEGTPSFLATTTRWTLQSAPAPAWTLGARAVPGPEGRLDVALELRADQVVQGAAARLAYPDTRGIELLDGSPPPVDVTPATPGRVTIGLKVTAEAPEILPLELRIRDAEERESILPLRLPRAGSPITLAPPSLTVDGVPTLAAPGQVRARVVAQDESQVDHIVVFGGPETVQRRRNGRTVVHDSDKLVWRPGKGKRLELTVDLPVAPGPNRYVLVAVDRDGTRTMQELHITGERPAR
jgi:carboxyl-terminal processing protease